MERYGNWKDKCEKINKWKERKRYHKKKNKENLNEIRKYKAMEKFKQSF